MNYDDDDTCIDASGRDYPEHDFGEIDCYRCGAEAPLEVRDV